MVVDLSARDLLAKERGLTVVELICAFAILATLSIAVVHTQHSQPRATTRAFQETLALRLAQAELESARAKVGQLVIGRQPIDLPGAARSLPDARGWRTAKLVAPGLFEVDAIVEWRPAAIKERATVRLTTRVVALETRQ
ncbi:MAG: type II secretion system GspH family protein [bacterium]|nr:type II secretion system GspH family protein [bacterium]